uniref:mitotic spindle assembly checkpoint protein MAD2B-like n=1 Tax=Myxine glutinosa TaxID=7769 RepID=UPI00358F0879
MTRLQVVVGCICEFLEVAFHYILYVRQIYPAGAFSRRLKYNVPVMVCLHPELCHYVEDVLEGVKPLLEQGVVQQIALVVLSPQGEPLERFVLEFDLPPSTPLCDEEHLEPLQVALRSFVLKLSISDAVLLDNPSCCSFAVFAYTLEGKEIPETMGLSSMQLYVEESELKTQ